MSADLSNIFEQSVQTYSFHIPYKKSLRDNNAPIQMPTGITFQNSKALIDHIEHIGRTLSLNIVDIKENEDDIQVFFTRRSDHFTVHSLILGTIPTNITIDMSPIDPSIDINIYAQIIDQYCRNEGIRFVLDVLKDEQKVSILLESNKDLAIVLRADDSLYFDTMALQMASKANGSPSPPPPSRHI